MQGVGDCDQAAGALGRWRSSEYQVYIRTPPEELASLSRTLAETQPTAGQQ